MIGVSRQELQFKNRKRLCSSWVQGLQCALPAEGSGLVPWQEKSPRLRIQVQSIVEAVRADRRSRSGTSDSAIFHRFLMHKSRTALPIQEGNTPPGQQLLTCTTKTMPDLASLGNGQGVSVESGDTALEPITVAWQFPEQGYHLLSLVIDTRNPEGRIKSL